MRHDSRISCANFARFALQNNKSMKASKFKTEDTFMAIKSVGFFPRDSMAKSEINKFLWLDVKLHNGLI